jgi:hypothetical protein
MNKTLRKYFKELEKYNDLSDIDNEIAFAEVVNKIALTKNPEVISLLLKFFGDDNGGEDIAMQSLQHGIESFPISDYIPALLTELQNMFIGVPDSCYYFLCIF